MSYIYDLAKHAAKTARFSDVDLAATWIYVQWAHETGGFTSSLCHELHNFGGLTQLAKNSHPQPDGNLFYMEFFSPWLFADYFGRYLRYYASDGIFDAINLHQYLTALKNGGYFGDDFSNYYQGCFKWLATIR